MKEYELVNLQGHVDNKFDLYGVKFDLNSKSFLFWKKKNVVDIKEVLILFDKRYENALEMKDNSLVLSFTRLSGSADVKSAILLFFQIFKDMNLRAQDDFLFQFIVGDIEQKELVEKLGNELNIPFVVVNLNKNASIDLAQNKNSDNNIGVNGSQMIDKYDNGELKKITIHDGSAYENNSLLNSEEEKLVLLREWMQDPVRARELMRMSESERDNLLTKAVLSGRKQYRLEEANQQLSGDKASDVAKNVAEHNNGLVNTELNIVQHTDFRDNQYSVVEKNGENVQVVNPNVSQSVINTNGMSVSNKKENVGVNNLSEEQMQQREVFDEVFYIDDSKSILNNDGEVIGRLYADGYRINNEDNSLWKYGEMLGYVGDYRSMGKSASMEISKQKRLILEKKEESENKSSGFANIAVVMFVLSALLLIGSVVLLFVLD